jgi:hypothetical protein
MERCTAARKAAVEFLGAERKPRKTLQHQEEALDLGSFLLECGPSFLV